MGQKQDKLCHVNEEEKIIERYLHEKYTSNF